jgi:ABC-type Fe3+ transport system substrate-binding protein
VAVAAVALILIIAVAAFIVYSSSSTPGQTSSSTTSKSSAASTTTSSSSSSSSTSVSTVDPDAALYQLALTEGTVVVYGSPTAQQFADVTTAFNAKYPNVKLQYVALQPPQAIPRINAELATQGYSADMALQAATAVYPLEQAGAVMPYVSSYASGFPKAVLDPLNQSTPIIELALGWVYNTQLVKPADVPTTMAQVADAKFKGLVVMNDPTTGTAFTQYWASLAGVLGNSTVYGFLHSLKNATSPVILPTTQSCATDVAGNAHAICLGAYMQEAAPNMLLGAPEKFLNITGLPLMITPSNAALLKNAQHPNAAKLLADFMASPAGQTAWGNIDVRTPVSQTVTAKWSLTSEIKAFDPGAGALVYFPTPAVASAASAWAKTFLFLKL